MEILGRILPSVDTRARPAELAMQKAASPPAGAARMLAAPAPPPAPIPQQEMIAQAADQVQAAEAVEATIFQLATPVVLAAGHTASVPIIDRKAGRIQQRVFRLQSISRRERLDRRRAR